MLVELIRQYQKSAEIEERGNIGDKIVVIISPPLSLYISLRTPDGMRDDILQEALKEIALKLDGFECRSDAKFYAFCYTVCRGKIADAYRRLGRIRQNEITGDEVSEAVMDATPQKPISDERLAIYHEMMALLSAVRPPCVDYLYLHYIAGLTFAELAIEFGFPSEASAGMATRRCLELARTLL